MKKEEDREKRRRPGEFLYLGKRRESRNMGEAVRGKMQNANRRHNTELTKDVTTQKTNFLCLSKIQYVDQVLTFLSVYIFFPLLDYFEIEQ